VTDFDLTQLYDDSKSLNQGALTIPGYSMDGWYGRIFGGCGFFDADKPIRKFTKKELHDLLHKEPTKISDLAGWVRGLAEPSVAPLLAKLTHTLDSFVAIGLGYLSLDRPSGTLSGGEAQRTRMIRHLGSALTDVTYVFDEPSIGLHPHDLQRMNTLLLRLRDKGNTVLVVEHKPEMIAVADHVIDLGPGAGTAGGTVVFEGTVEGLRKSGTLTGRHLSDRAALKCSSW
jgi:excinuclease UvrABC ATPase subunit